MVLGQRRHRNRWECGGRYRVAASLVLREAMPLESRELFWLNRGDEVLILELTLVIVGDNDPRLRARVRSQGQIGWLTIERPKAKPLLDHRNMLDAEALLGRRLTVFSDDSCESSTAVHVWEVGGAYRTLAQVSLYSAANLVARKGRVRKGELVYVQEVLKVLGKPGESRLFVVAGSPDDAKSRRGWVNSSDSFGNVVIDFRDHLEYDKALKGLPAGEPPDGEFPDDPVPRLSESLALKAPSVRESDGSAIDATTMEFTVADSTHCHAPLVTSKDGESCTSNRFLSMEPEEEASCMSPSPAYKSLAELDHYPGDTRQFRDSCLDLDPCYERISQCGCAYFVFEACT